MTYVRKRKPRILRFMLLFIILALIIGMTTFGITRLFNRYPKAMMEVNESIKTAGNHKKRRSTTDTAYYVLHYPDTKFKNLNSWIASEMDTTMNTYPSDTEATEERHQIKQDYKSIEVNDQYISVQLETYENDVLVNKVSRVYDVEAQDFLKTDFLKDKAQRVINKQIRDQLGPNYNLSEITLDPLYNNLYLDNSNVEFIFFNEVVSFNYKDHPHYLNRALGDVEPTDDFIPSVYLDYGFENNKMVALTFDDGPHAVYSKQIMDLMEKYNGQVTFFVLGNRIRDHQENIREMVDRGHQVASHSYDHPNFSKLSIEQINDQLSKTEKEYEIATGMHDDLFVRPPYGLILDEQIKQLSVTFINWDVDTEDWISHNPTTICETALRDTADGSIVLLHEIYQESYESLDCILKGLSEKGFQFVTVRELLLAKGEDITGGGLYYYAN